MSAVSQPHSYEQALKIMQYKYVKDQQDYSDLSSGRVLYALPGHPAFPVRLASEIFQRCFARRQAIYGNEAPCVLYDPCCGAAYHLSVLTYLHGEHIREVIASDIDEKAVAAARRNLELLSDTGLDRRIGEISEMLEQYQKVSHRDALESGYALRKRIAAVTQEHLLTTRVFQANATDSRAILNHVKPKSVDLVFTDIPYGQHSHWRNPDSQERLNPLWSMLDTLFGILSSSGIVAIVSDKQQKASHESYQRLEQFQVGKRRVVILKRL